MTVFEKIEAQQKGHEDTAIWMVGEHLKDICRSDPHCAEIVAADLDNPEFSLKEVEKKIKAKADEIHSANKKSNFACVIPSVAEKIIRDFFGLPAAGSHTPPSREEPAPVSTDGGSFLDLASFL